MDREFWLARWRDQQIGFHEGVPNSLLVAHFAGLGVAVGGRVFVPLCGKSQDMHYLRAQGCTVVGAELSRAAAEQFFSEAGLTPQVDTTGRLERFEAGGVTIFVGDIFDLEDELLGAVDAIYDRAALVALPGALRGRYAARLISLTHGARQLLVTFEHESPAGPPFSVEEAEVRTHYSMAYRLECAERREVSGGIKGCAADESVWLLRPL